MPVEHSLEVQAAAAYLKWRIAQETRSSEIGFSVNFGAVVDAVYIAAVYGASLGHIRNAVIQGEHEATRPPEYVLPAHPVLHESAVVADAAVLAANVLETIIKTLNQRFPDLTAHQLYTASIAVFEAGFARSIEHMGAYIATFKPDSLKPLPNTPDETPSENRWHDVRYRTEVKEEIDRRLDEEYRSSLSDED